MIKTLEKTNERSQVFNKWGDDDWNKGKKN